MVEMLIKNIIEVFGGLLLHSFSIIMSSRFGQDCRHRMLNQSGHGTWPHPERIEIYVNLMTTTC